MKEYMITTGCRREHLFFQKWKVIVMNLLILIVCAVIFVVTISVTIQNVFITQNYIITSSDN